MFLIGMITVFAFFLLQPVFGAEKVTICHAAGREGTTKFVTLNLAYPAVYGEAGHFYENGTPRAGHEDDYLGACEEPEPSITPSVTPPPQCEEECEEPTPSVTPTPTVTPTPIHSPSPRDMASHRNNHSSGGGCPNLPDAITHFSVETGTPNDNTLHLYWPIALHTQWVNILYTDTVPGDWKYSVIRADNTGSFDVGELKNGTHYWFTLQSVSDCGMTPATLSIDPLP